MRQAMAPTISASSTSTRRKRQAKGEADQLPRDLPIIPKAFEPRLKLIGKPVYAGDAELKANPRSRSAVMRIAEKLR